MRKSWQIVEINERLSRFSVVNTESHKLVHYYVAHMGEVVIDECKAVVFTKNQRKVEIDLDSGRRKFLA